MLASPDRVTAAVLIIGDEILSGRTQDTNLRDIALYFGAQGVEIAEARVVGDIKDDVVSALNLLRRRYAYVVTTGGIGPTHDDITADCVAEAFGRPLFEHPDILAMMQARWQGELTPARRRMARVPEGGSLIKNPVNGPPGFQVENVFVLAGVPQIMRGMLQDIGHRLKGGAVVVSKSIRVEGTGEGVLAAPLEAVALAHPALSLGSYPFFGPDGYGSSLVVRGRDPAEVDAAAAELIGALTALGVTGVKPPEDL
jgi:molybdenum cofactor synthesis domain-containing protein